MKETQYIDDGHWNQYLRLLRPVTVTHGAVVTDPSGQLIGAYVYDTKHGKCEYLWQDHQFHLSHIDKSYIGVTAA